MADDKTPEAEIVWLYSRHQAALPFAQSLSGWLSTNSHRGRQAGDYCPWECELCDEQRVIDGAVERQTLEPLVTPDL